MIGEYLVEEKIHSARTRDVYRALLEKEEYAIKLTAPLRSTESSYRLRKSLCSLHHDNVLFPTNVFLHKGHIVEAMPFFRQARLSECWQNLSYATACTITHQLLSGLTYLHEKNIEHRDAHPQNIFINDSRTNIVLYDFHFSKKIRRDRMKNAAARDLESAALTFKYMVSSKNIFNSDVPDRVRKGLDSICKGKVRVHSAEEFLNRTIHA
jgi:serine/threonine protein kinase